MYRLTSHGVIDSRKDQSPVPVIDANFQIFLRKTLVFAEKLAAFRYYFYLCT